MARPGHPKPTPARGTRVPAMLQREFERLLAHYTRTKSADWVASWKRGWQNAGN